MNKSFRYIAGVIIMGTALAAAAAAQQRASATALVTATVIPSASVGVNLPQSSVPQEGSSGTVVYISSSDPVAVDIAGGSTPGVHVLLQAGRPYGLLASDASVIRLSYLSF